MNSRLLRIDRWEDLPGAISRMQLSGADHRAVLLQALFHGVIAHVEVQRETSSALVKKFIGGAQRPALVVMGNNDDEPTGPMHWRQAARLIRWAKLVIVHSAAGRPDEYKAAVVKTLAARRVLMIETDSAHSGQWFAAAALAPHRPEIWTILPECGRHPVPANREKMN